MRRTRRLLLAAILLLLVGVGATYYIRRSSQEAHPVKRPKTLPAEIVANAEEGWNYAKYDQHGKPIVQVHARHFQEIRTPHRFELGEVELHIYGKDGTHYDKVGCAKATFDVEQKRLYSDGAVEITLGVPAAGQPAGQLLTIHSSGVTFESETGRASTDREASFNFEQGEGKGVGALYDPTAHELQMKSAVDLVWRGKGPKTVPMKIETGQLIYREGEAKVYLSPWSKLTRDTMTTEGGNAIVTLDHGVIRQVDAENGHGADVYPKRRIEYAAAQLQMRMNDDGVVEKIIGDRNARLLSHTENGDTTMTADHVDLSFEVSDHQSLLTEALGMGHGNIVSKPVTRSAQAPPETRVLRSEVIVVKMRPGGQDIQRVDTRAPGQVEFIPNAPGEHHRFIDGNPMTMIYGPQNQLRSFLTHDAKTRTDPLPAKKPLKPGEAPPEPQFTWSKDLDAEFEPKTGQMKRLEQWNDFRYREGARQARADRANLDSARNVITLLKSARIWDPTGSAAGDRIVLDQTTGDFDVEGHVTSTRLPDRKGSGSAMLSNDQPVQARAAHMTSREDNSQITYQGNAVLWQDANRVEGNRILINRDEQTLTADGKVVSQLIDSSKNGAVKNAGPIFTVVHAPHMVYSDDDKVADYTGGVVLVRPDMNIKGQQIRAFLKDDNGASSLDKAFANGRVDIFQKAPDRTRRGTGEHAEYYVSEDKVVLQGEAVLVDSLRGTTAGKQLTYFSMSDRLLVDGAEKKPAVSNIKMHKK